MISKARQKVLDDEKGAEKRELARRAKREKRRQDRLDKMVSPPQHDAAPDAPSRSQPRDVPRFELKPPRPGTFWYPLYKWLGGV